MGLDTVDLIVRIEKEFAIHILDSEAEKIVTVDDLIKTVIRYTEVKDVSINEKVIAIVSDHTGINENEILPEHSLTNDLGLD